MIPNLIGITCATFRLILASLMKDLSPKLSHPSSIQPNRAGRSGRGNGSGFPTDAINATAFLDFILAISQHPVRPAAQHRPQETWFAVSLVCALSIGWHLDYKFDSQ